MTGRRIAIRPASPDDAAAIAPLFDAYRRFYEQDTNLEIAERFLSERLARQESEVLMACDEDGWILGFCQLFPTFCSVEAKPIFSLYDLFVQPAHRRSGVGRALLLAAEELARERGKARMDLTTARSNLKAQALYESLGWELDTVFLAYSRRIGS
ncbi:MAG: GNAT family N-acetyltransferase [Zoogloea sp.]|nr:MAG: GNAT family N-acetyltransferase [Zoogloea sp.]